MENYYDQYQNPDPNDNVIISVDVDVNNADKLKQLNESLGDTQNRIGGIVGVAGRLFEVVDKLTNIPTQVAGVISRPLSSISNRLILFGTGLMAASWAMGHLTQYSGDLYARLEVLQRSLTLVGQQAGHTKQEILSTVEAVKKQGITTQQAQQAVLGFVRANLDLAQAAKFARAAQNLAVIAGEDSSQTLGTLIYAISSYNTMVLRQYGLTKTLTQVFRDYAKAHNTTIAQLTEYQQKQAMMNYILKEGAKAQSVYEEAMKLTGKRMTSMARYEETIMEKIGAATKKHYDLLRNIQIDFYKSVSEIPQKYYNIFVGGFDMITKGLPAMVGSLMTITGVLGKVFAMGMTAVGTMASWALFDAVFNGVLNLKAIPQLLSSLFNLARSSWQNATGRNFFARLGTAGSLFGLGLTRAMNLGYAGQGEWGLAAIGLGSNEGRSVFEQGTRLFTGLLRRRGVMTEAIERALGGNVGSISRGLSSLLGNVTMLGNAFAPIAYLGIGIGDAISLAVADARRGGMREVTRNISRYISRAISMSSHSLGNAMAESILYIGRFNIPFINIAIRSMIPAMYAAMSYITNSVRSFAGRLGYQVIRSIPFVGRILASFATQTPLQVTMNNGRSIVLPAGGLIPLPGFSGWRQLVRENLRFNIAQQYVNNYLRGNPIELERAIIGRARPMAVGVPGAIGVATSDIVSNLPARNIYGRVTVRNLRDLARYTGFRNEQELITAIQKGTAKGLPSEILAISGISTFQMWLSNSYQAVVKFVKGIGKVAVSGFRWLFTSFTGLVALTVGIITTIQDSISKKYEAAEKLHANIAKIYNRELSLVTNIRDLLGFRQKSYVTIPNLSNIEQRFFNLGLTATPEMLNSIKSDYSKILELQRQLIRESTPTEQEIMGVKRTPYGWNWWAGFKNWIYNRFGRGWYALWNTVPTGMLATGNRDVYAGTTPLQAIELMKRTGIMPEQHQLRAIVNAIPREYLEKEIGKMQEEQRKLLNIFTKYNTEYRLYLESEKKFNKALSRSEKEKYLTAMQYFSEQGASNYITAKEQYDNLTKAIKSLTNTMKNLDRVSKLYAATLTSLQIGLEEQRRYTSREQILTYGNKLGVITHLEMGRQMTAQLNEQVLFATATSFLYNNPNITTQELVDKLREKYPDVDLIVLDKIATIVLKKNEINTLKNKLQNATSESEKLNITAKITNAERDIKQLYKELDSMIVNTTAKELKSTTKVIKAFIQNILARVKAGEVVSQEELNILKNYMQNQQNEFKGKIIETQLQYLKSVNKGIVSVEKQLLNQQKQAQIKLDSLLKTSLAINDEVELQIQQAVANVRKMQDTIQQYKMQKSLQKPYLEYYDYLNKMYNAQGERVWNVAGSIQGNKLTIINTGPTSLMEAQRRSAFQSLLYNTFGEILSGAYNREYAFKYKTDKTIHGYKYVAKPVYQSEGVFSTTLGSFGTNIGSIAYSLPSEQYIKQPYTEIIKGVTEMKKTELPAFNIPYSKTKSGEINLDEFKVSFMNKLPNLYNSIAQMATNQVNQMIKRGEISATEAASVFNRLFNKHVKQAFDNIDNSFKKGIAKMEADLKKLNEEYNRTHSEFTKKQIEQLKENLKVAKEARDATMKMRAGSIKEMKKMRDETVKQFEILGKKVLATIKNMNAQLVMSIEQLKDRAKVAMKRLAGDIITPFEQATTKFKYLFYRQQEEREAYRRRIEEAKASGTDKKIIEALEKGFRLLKEKQTLETKTIKTELMAGLKKSIANRIINPLIQRFGTYEARQEYFVNAQLKATKVAGVTKEDLAYLKSYYTKLFNISNMMNTARMKDLVYGTNKYSLIASFAQQRLSIEQSALSPYEKQMAIWNLAKRMSESTKPRVTHGQIEQLSRALSSPEWRQRNKMASGIEIANMKMRLKLIYGEEAKTMFPEFFKEGISASELMTAAAKYGLRPVSKAEAEALQKRLTENAYKKLNESIGKAKKAFSSLTDRVKNLNNAFDDLKDAIKDLTNFIKSNISNNKTTKVAYSQSSTHVLPEPNYFEPITGGYA